METTFTARDRASWIYFLRKPPSSEGCIGSGWVYLFSHTQVYGICIYGNQKALRRFLSAIAGLRIEIKKSAETKVSTLFHAATQNLEFAQDHDVTGWLHTAAFRLNGDPDGIEGADRFLRGDDQNTLTIFIDGQ